MRETNAVSFSWTVEEVRVLMTLTGTNHELSLWGFKGFEGTSDDGFDFGMRALISRGLVVVDADGVQLADLGTDVVRCACSPASAGLLFGSTAETYDIAAYGCADGMVLTCGFASDGVVIGTVIEGELVDHLVSLVQLAEVPVADDKWLLALRVQPVEGEPVDVLVGALGLGLSEGASVVSATEAQVREMLRNRVS